MADEVVVSVTPDGVVTDSVGSATGSRPVGRTAVQVGGPGAVLTVGTWLAQMNHWDLDPGAGTDIPADVSGAIIVLATIVVAVVMNRNRA